MLQSESVLLVSIVFINGATPAYIIGPLLYFYVRSVLTDSSKFKKNDLIHFVPVVLYLIAASAYIFTPWSVKESYAKLIIQERFYFWNISNEIVNWLIPNSVNFVSRPGLLLFYSIISLVKLIKFRYISGNVNIIRKHYLNINWLIFLLVFVIILTFAHTVLTIISIQNEDLHYFASINTLQIISVIGFIGIIILPFLYPKVLYGLHQFSPSEELKEKINSFTADIAVEHSNTSENQSKQYPEFDSVYLQFIEKTVDQNMTDDKTYLQKGCNMQFFANQLNIPAHHLSYYFREVKKQSFNDYRNMWRIKHSKELIKNSKNNDYTIEGIGMLSGFSSKNAFFTAFKKYENTTPGTYAENIENIVN
jgi:AraC-like DNA-binding protein